MPDEVIAEEGAKNAWWQGSRGRALIGFGPAVKRPVLPLSRRSVLAAGTAAMIPAMRTSASAQEGTTWFLTLSAAATGHPDLDATTATRLLAALDATDPGFTARAMDLARLHKSGMDPAALLEVADLASLKPTMLTIVAAWYTGTVGPGVTGTVVAYADALMYRATVDAVPAQTYCGGGPLWWTAPPPALGIASAGPEQGPPVAPAAAGREGPAPGRQP